MSVRENRHVYFCIIEGMTRRAGHVCAGHGSILGISQTIKQKSYENIQE